MMDVAIDLMESGDGESHADNVRNFVQDVHEHIQRAFDLEPQDKIAHSHLYFGMMKPDGTDCWWMDYMHPYSVMLQANGIEPRAQINGDKHGLGRVHVFADESIEETVCTTRRWMLAEEKNMTEEQ